MGEVVTTLYKQATGQSWIYGCPSQAVALDAPSRRLHDWDTD
jgi:hypothetical protein